MVATGPIRKALQHLGRQGAFLLFLALLDVTIGYAMRQQPPLGLTSEQVYHPFVDIMPLPLWVAWWFATAALVATAALWHPLKPAAFGCAALLKSGWAMGYVVGWAEHLPLFVRGYQSATIWAAFAALVVLVSGWQENRRISPLPPA
jgi:hypothetical protein